MKNRFIAFLVISFLSLMAVNGQTNNKKINPLGTWKFEAPYAPEGYTTGTITIGLEENKYNVSISFTGNEYKIPGDNVKAVTDSVFFSVFVEGQDVRIMLKQDDASKMTGKAVYSEGEIPLALTRDSLQKEVKK